MNATIPEATSLHAWKAIADQRQADIERLKLHCDSLEAALRARTEELYPDLRAEIDLLRDALRPFAAFSEKAEAFVAARAKDGGSPILPSTDFRLADFKRAAAALMDDKGKSA